MKQEEIYYTKLKELVDKYNHRVFVYPEYPHKSFWKSDINQNSYENDLIFSANNPSILYIHIPFCKQQCFYCTCHTCITDNYDDIKKYLIYLYKEIDMIKDFLETRGIQLNIKEIHIGGGSPSLLKNEDFLNLINKIKDIAYFNEIKEFSIEIDPRNVDEEKLIFYNNYGVNRISFGIQEFNHKVQKAINRIQPFEIVEKLLNSNVRKLFPNGINFDILIGLPYQYGFNIKETMNKVIKLYPDRICFSYLFLSTKYYKHQLLMFDGKDGKLNLLPNEHEKKIIFIEGKKILENNGYKRIGYEHFAKETDKLTKSLKDGKIGINSLGLISNNKLNVLGLGASSISVFNESYYQNKYLNELYYNDLDKNIFPLYKYFKLNDDDIIRRFVIHQIRNFNKLDFNIVGIKFGINFYEYFKDELNKLKEFERDKLIIETYYGFEVTEIGKEFVLYISGVFDKYLK